MSSATNPRSPAPKAVATKPAAFIRGVYLLAGVDSTPFERLFSLVFRALGLYGEDFAGAGVDVHLPCVLAAGSSHVDRPEPLALGSLQLSAANPGARDLAQGDPFSLRLGDRVRPVDFTGGAARDGIKEDEKQDQASRWKTKAGWSHKNNKVQKA